MGLPGAAQGLQAEDPTIATALKAQGYATGQFGKNHLGDRDEHLPTQHGFDEFFGNLYHLNAEEEPENVDYPKDPEFRKKFGPRGVLHTWANADGTQRIEDTGPLTKKRMETCDEEFRDAAVDFIKRQHEAETPFFVWFNSTHMHFRTHPKPESIGRAGRWQSEYHDTMLDHDDIVGDLLKHPRRPRHRRQHHRHVLHRQRSAHEQLARRRHDAVPQREELELGRGVPGSGHGALARAHPGGHACSTASSATTTGSSRCLRRRACPISPTSSSRAPNSTAPPSRCISTGTTSCPTSPARSTRARASTSSTSPTTAT